MKLHRLELLPVLLARYKNKFNVNIETGAVTGLKPYPNHKGYLYVSFWHNGKGYDYKVHELVAFLAGMDLLDKTVDHINGNKQDNRASNLQTLTASANHKKYVKASNYVSAKLTVEDVKAIRARYTGKYGEITALAKEYGVSYRNMFDVVKGVTWKHV